jgi:outer membrane protein assembly factor BamB
MRRLGRGSIALGLLLSWGGPMGAEEPAEGWLQFRGDRQLTGIASGGLRQELELQWTFEAEEGFESTAAILRGTIYVGSLDGHLYALDLPTGELRWKYQATDEIKSSPLVLGGVVYFGDEGGTFHAVDAESGQARWTFAAEASITSSANHTHGCVLFGSYDNHLYCLADSDGSLRWKVETQGYVHGSPAVFATSAVSAGCDGTLRIVDVRNGAVSGELELGGYVGASPAILDGHVFVATFENRVLSIDLDEPKVTWSYANPEREFPFYSSVAVRKDILVIGGRDKLVHALSPQTGEVLWTSPTRSRVDASPVIVGNRVFIAAESGEILALDIATGAHRWVFETGSAFEASPSVAQGFLVIGDLDGALYAFR